MMMQASGRDFVIDLAKIGLDLALGFCSVYFNLGVGGLVCR